MARASAAERCELVTSEPLIAARVLATVNSPLYGLQSPVTDIGQAVTYLGVASVRGLCLQHMLADAFPTRLPGVRKGFNALWTASAIASELAVRLDRMPGLPAAIPLNTQVVLGFVGRLLVVPPESAAGERLPRLALAGLCARLGERLALGQLASLDGYRPADDDAPDVQHLRGALQQPALAGLDKALQAPELLRTVRQMLAPAAVPA